MTGCSKGFFAVAVPEIVRQTLTLSLSPLLVSSLSLCLSLFLCLSLSLSPCLIYVLKGGNLSSRVNSVPLS